MHFKFRQENFLPGIFVQNLLKDILIEVFLKFYKNNFFSKFFWTMVICSE